MAKAKVDHVSVTVVDLQATTNEEKFKKADLYGKTATAFLNSIKNSPWLSNRVADVELTAKQHPETGAVLDGNLGSIKFFDAADGTRVEDPKARRFKVDLDRITFKTTNKEGKEYEVSKPVNRDRETGAVKNLEDGKVPGVKTILTALNEESELFLNVDKTDIDGKDVWVITKAEALGAPQANQKAELPRYAITVTSPAEGKIRIAGPEIKDSEELKNYIKNDLGGKWNKQETAWDAPMPEGMTTAKMFYAVIEKAREIGVTPSPEAGIKGMAANAPEGASLADAAAAVNQKASGPSVKA